MTIKAKRRLKKTAKIFLVIALIITAFMLICHLVLPALWAAVKFVVGLLIKLFVIVSIIVGFIMAIDN